MTSDYVHGRTRMRFGAACGLAAASDVVQQLLVRTLAEERLGVPL